MIIWRGMGIIVPFITFGLAWLLEWIFKGRFAEPIGYVVGGVIVGLIGIGANLGGERKMKKATQSRL